MNTDKPTPQDPEAYDWGGATASEVKLKPVRIYLGSRESTRGQIVKGCKANSGPDGTPGREQPHDDLIEIVESKPRSRNQMVDYAYNRLEHTQKLLPDARIGWFAFESAAEVYETRHGNRHPIDDCALWIKTRDGLETLTLTPGIEMILEAYELAEAKGFDVTAGTFISEIYAMMYGKADKQDWQGEATTNDDGKAVMPRFDAMGYTFAIGLARHEHKRRERTFVEKWLAQRSAAAA
jgi:hypothetical protein